jgi:hypothetical protein
MQPLSPRTAIAAAAGAFTSFAAVAAPFNIEPQTVDGLPGYIGFVPAEIIKGYPVGHPERSMHGRVPRGRDEYHIVAAIFDAASGTRISDATIVARYRGPLDARHGRFSFEA